MVLTVFVVATAWETFALRKLRPPVRILLVGEIAKAATLLQDLPSGCGYQLIGVVDDDEHPAEADPQTPLRSRRAAARLGHRRAST